MRTTERTEFAKQRLGKTLSCLGKEFSVSHSESYGVLFGIMGVLESFHQHESSAALFESLFELFPDDFDYNKIPWNLIGKNEGHPKLNWSNFCSFSDLWFSIALESDNPDKHRTELIKKYLYIVSGMRSDSERGTLPFARLQPFHQSGSQWIANFSLDDTSKPVDVSKINWHGQFTSQWLWAGCILFQDGEFSIHT